MPKNPEREGSPRLLTIDQIAEKHGVSRSSVHTYRRGGTFPRPVPVEGTTRVLFDAVEVAAWFKANPKQQGRRSDLPAKTKPNQGEPVTTTTDPRIAILSRLNDPPYNTTAERHCTPWSDAEKLLAAYRAAVIAEVVEALTSKAQELSAEAEAEMRRDLEDEAQVWHDAAAAAEKLKRAEPEV